MKDVQGFIDAFNKREWEKVAKAINTEATFDLDAEIEYASSTMLGWWVTNKTTTYRKLFVQAQDVPKKTMASALQKDDSTTAELIDDMINAKSIGVKQAIAEDLSENASEKAFEHRKKVIEWLSGVVESQKYQKFPEEDYNEIVENLVKAKIITIQDAISVYWSNYDAIKALLLIDKTAVAGSEIKIRKRVSIGIGLTDWEDKEISMLQLFVLEDDITADSLKTLLTRSVTPDIIIAAMIECDDAIKMNLMAQKLVELKHKIEDKKLILKLKQEKFQESQELLFMHANLDAHVANVGLLFTKTISDLDKYIANNNINVIAGYVNNKDLNSAEKKLIDKYIAGLGKDDLAAFYKLIKDEKKARVIKENFTAIALYKNGNVDILKAHLKEIKLDADKDGNNILYYVLMRKDYALAEYIIDVLGSDILHRANNKGITPLMLFAAIKHESVNELKGFVQKIVGKDGVLGSIAIEDFIRICAVKNPDLMDLVIRSKYPDIEQRKRFVQSLFQKSFFQKDIDLILKLIVRYSPHELDLSNGTSTFKPLEYAYVNKSQELFNVLVRDGNIKIDVVLSNNKTILHDALTSRNVDVINALIDSKHKFELNKAHNPEHNPPLVDAMLALSRDAMKGVGITNAEIKAFMRLLNVDGLDINAKDHQSQSTPIMFIYQAIVELGDKNNEQKEQLEKLFNAFINHKDFDALAVNSDGMNLLSLISASGDKERLREVLKKQIFVKDNITIPKKDGFIPMLAMIGMGDTRIFAEIKWILLNTNDAVEKEHFAIAFLQQDANKLDALMASVISGNKEIFDDIRKIIGDKKINFKRMDALGNTVFHHAVGNSEILKSLLNVVNIDIQNKDGMTALSIAVCKGNMESLKVLLDNGADFNLPDKHGMTPLMYAILNGDEKVINLLLSQRDIDINAKNKKGLTAFMLAALTDERLETKNLDVKMMQELNQSGGDWVGNNKIMKKLILRGAEPTFGYAYNSIGENLIYSLVSSSAAIRSLNYMGTYLAAAGRMAPVVGMVSAAETGYFNSIFSGLAAWQISKKVSASVYTKAMSWMEFGPRIDFTENRLMIGVYTYSWFGSVVAGGDLKKLLQTHEIYKHGELENVLFVHNKNSLNNNRADKTLQDHDDLVARYFAVNRELGKYQWPWARKKLQALKAEILEADTVVVQNIRDKVEPEEEAKILDLIADKNRDKVIYKILTKKKHEYESLQNIIKAINANEVVASIPLIEAVVEFNKRKKEIKEEVALPSLFSRIFKPYSGSKIAIDVLQDERLNNLKTGMEALDKTQPKESEVASAAPTGKLHQCVEFVAGVSGKNPKDVAKSVAGVASYVGGALGGFTALSVLSPTFGATYGRAVVGAVATGVTIQATSLFGVLFGAATSVVTMPVVLPAVAVVGGAVYAFSHKKENATAITADELKNTPTSDIVDFIDKHSAIEEESIVVRERSLSTSSNASTAANLSEVDRSPKITSTVDLKMPNVEEASLERKK